MGERVTWPGTAGKGRMLASFVKRLDTILGSAQGSKGKVKGQEPLEGKRMLSWLVHQIEVGKFPWKV